MYVVWGNILNALLDTTLFFKMSYRVERECESV